MYERVSLLDIFLSVNGKTGLIADEDLLAGAAKFGIGTARRALGEVREPVRSVTANKEREEI